MQSEQEFYESGSYEQIAVSAQGGLAARLFHGQVERGLNASHTFPLVLEVGALTGQHLQYVKHGFESWVLTDIVATDECFTDPRVQFRQCDVENLPFADSSFDRVAVTCVLHHIANPMQALREMRRVCKPGGVISILLPVDPGLPYEIALELTSIRRAKKAGLESEARMSRALGHRNHFKSLKWQLESVFEDDELDVKYWPIPWNMRVGNIFSSWQIRKAAFV